MPFRRIEKIETYSQDATPLNIVKMAKCYKKVGLKDISKNQFRKIGKERKKYDD